MKDITSPLITEAKRILKTSPYDEIHDITHHERVWKNAREIAKSLNTDINMSALHIAVFWHDVSLGKKNDSEKRGRHVKETTAYLLTRMKKLNVPKETKKLVYEAVLNHEITTKIQPSLEAKILFDADKLDAFHKERYLKLLQLHKDKKLSRLKTILMVQAAKLWLKTVRKRYHFEVSRKLHDDRIHQILKNKEVVQVAKSLGVDIEKLVK